MMTQKNFEALAAALYESQARNSVIEAVAAVCAAANPKFKRARFRSLAIIDANSPEAKRREELRQMADDHFSESEGLEIDGDAAISEGDDNGAYVAAWLWVDFSGTKFCKGENGSHEDCSDGCPAYDQAAKETK